jgi:hypothetical protein
VRGERSGLRREERWTKEERKEGGATESEARERERVERREGQKRKGQRGMGEGRAARNCWAVASAVTARRPLRLGNAATCIAHPHDMLRHAKWADKPVHKPTQAATRAATDRLVCGDSESGEHDGHAGNGFSFIIRAPACSFSFVWRWVRMK